MAILRISDFAADGFSGVSVVPTSNRAKDAMANRERMAAAARESLLADPYWTTAQFGRILGIGQRDDVILPSPAEERWGYDFTYDIAPKMMASVLPFGYHAERRFNVVEHLELSWLAGMPGDPESERARAAVEIAFNAFDEHAVGTRNMAEVFMLGFRVAENVYGVINRGEAKNLICPEQFIPRPPGWFGFDAQNRCRFKPRGRDYSPQFMFENPLVPELKVMTARAGDLHTRYGRGFAEQCYPTVFRIDELRKRLDALTERWSYMPLIAKCDCPPTTKKHAELEIQIQSQWKNTLLIYSDSVVGGVQFSTETGGAYAAANATGQMLLQTIDRDCEYLGRFINGSVQSSSQPDASGSYAKDKVADSQLMYMAPSDAAVKEAYLNRGFVRPIMLLNFPTLEQEKWPRASIDASFGEDLKLFVDLVKAGVEMKMPISWITFSERTGIPIAGPEDGPLLEVKQGNAGAPQNVEQSLQAFSEPVHVMRLGNGVTLQIPYDAKVMTPNGPKRISQLNRNGGEIVTAIEGVDPRFLRAA